MNGTFRLPSARIIPLVAGYCLLTLSGCSQSPSTKTDSVTSRVPYLTANNFTQLIDTSSQPVLAEFSVTVGCSRCDEMRPQVESLAKSLAGSAKVCRVNFSQERQLMTELQITICPTYIAFLDGQELFRMSHPTSGDLLLARLAQSTSSP